MQENKSIEQLENDFWQETNFATPLVQKCYAYRKLPIDDLTIGQIQLLLGQKIGVKFLLPKALNFLEKNILAEGNYYPGDLLMAVLSLEGKDWEGNENAIHNIKSLLQNNMNTLKVADEELMKEVKIFLNKTENRNNSST